MEIINKINKNNELIEHNPNFEEEDREFIDYTLDGGEKKWKVEGFRRADGRLILRLTHDEISYTTGQKEKGIVPPVKKQDHYHYYLAESTKLGTYTCGTCYCKKPKLKCCKKPSKDFFEDGYDGGGCYACYDWQIELKCIKCYIKQNRFDKDCWLNDNGDYIIRSQNYLE